MTTRSTDGAVLDGVADVDEANPAASFYLDPPGLGRWGMSDWQRRVLNDPSNRILVRKGNKVGGSCLASLAIKAYLDGWHPTWRRPNRPVDVLYVAADLDTTYRKDVSRRLREFFTDADLSPRCTFDRARGFMVAGSRGIETKNGDLVSFVSGTQAALSLSGSSADVIAVNEPPREAAWGEVTRAAAEWGAPILVNFTPLPAESMVGGDDLTWFKKQIEGSGWSEHVIPLRYHTAPHRRPEDIDQQILDMFPWERAQREDAAWQGPAPDRRFANFDDARCIFRGDSLLELPGLRRGEQLMIGLGFDHGELTGHQTCILGAWVDRPSDPRAWALDCYVSTGRTTTAQDASGVAGMLGRRGLGLLQVDRAVGDINSAGKSSEFDKVNAEFESEFKLLAGTRQAPFVMANANKRPGSVRYGEHVLNESFGREVDGVPALMIHERCEPLIVACRRWNGKRDKHLHLIDTSRYLFVPILSTAWRNVIDLAKANAALADVPTVWSAMGSTSPSEWGTSEWDGNG
jgi:hypothetical protein